MRHSINFISLGCFKNLVDSERLMKTLQEQGYDVRFEDDSKPCDIVVINTCGFIGDAKEESIEEILKWAQAKKRGKINKLIVMGCLSQRYRQELEEEIKEVDFWAGKLDWPTVANFICGGDTEPSKKRIITTPKHHAYIKIAEGCNRFCAFCAIPLITGRYQSRSVEDICNEVRALATEGVKEFNVIAQDLSYYGKDFDGESHLAELIERMASIEGVRRIRLHYFYPTDFPMEILDVMNRHKNVCRYIDLALQHSADLVLENMRRHITSAQQNELLKKIRAKVDGIHIRTTLMTGFPGEGEEEFKQLCDFVEEQRFERMGAFAYCEEEGTYAAEHFDDIIDEETKQKRLDKIMSLQEEIALRQQQAKVGGLFDVVIDSIEGEYFICRTEFDSPEVDPVVMIPVDDSHEVGEFYMARITSAEPFELFGEFVD